MQLPKQSLIGLSGFGDHPPDARQQCTHQLQVTDVSGNQLDVFGEQLILGGGVLLITGSPMLCGLCATEVSSAKAGR